MGTIVEKRTIELTTMECPVCDVTYAMPETLRSRCEDHRGEQGYGWYCVNGHSLHYPGETAEQKARKEADRAKLEAMEERDKRIAAENAKRRLEKRIANGVCPCCNRSFVNVQRHMKTKHPEVTKG